MQKRQSVLQIAKKREVKGKGERGKYTHLNEEFQRIARRYKKAFLSDLEAYTAIINGNCIVTH